MPKFWFDKEHNTPLMVLYALCMMNGPMCVSWKWHDTVRPMCEGGEPPSGLGRGSVQGEKEGGWRFCNNLHYSNGGLK